MGAIGDDPAGAMRPAEARPRSCRSCGVAVRSSAPQRRLARKLAAEDADEFHKSIEVSGR
jgi:hypothetical protein